jgi:tetratricopeptide (TPR) repeat protein/predicted aspartyl protease
MFFASDARLYGSVTAVAALAVLFFAPDSASAACRLGKLAELPVTMSNLRPLVTAKINDDEVKFLADSGAFYSMISRAAAAEHNLKLRAGPMGLFVYGIGGATQISVATVATFTLADIPLHNIQFLVGGSEAGSGSVGVLGQNVLRIGDVEYDLANGVIRLMRPEDCKRDALLAYWVTGSQSYSVMDINPTSARSPHTTGSAYLNGAKIVVTFDTGAATSLLSMKAAERGGITPVSPEVTDGGYSHGIGQGSSKTFIGRFASFKIGGEEIKNARLRFGELGMATDMLLGSDFFLSHRVYVANGEHKLYFTYNGGPVFNLSRSPTGAPAPAAGASRPPTDTSSPAASGSSPAPVGSSEPGADAAAPQSKGEPVSGDAAELSRLGMALAGRRDFQQALADLDRACELDPGNPEYFYQRGVVHWRNRQSDLAMADFNKALELKPDHVAALMSRAELRLNGKDFSGAKIDLDAADRSAAKQADARFELALDYQRADFLEAAIAQYEIWVLSHAVDAKLATALNNLCFARGLLGQDLAKALDNCNAAFKLAAKASPLSASILDWRGLVRLRLGDYDKSIADYDASLKVTPKSASALYGRGVAKMKNKKTAEGEADIADAIKISPNIGEQFKKRGITPEL